MASLSELVDYAKAKQPRNGLAEVAAHFISGASSGYDAGQKAKLEKYDQILKSAQAIKAQEEARTLKIQNDLWDSYINGAKATGDIPLTAGENLNGKTVLQRSMGEQPAPTSDLAKLASMFSPTDTGMKPTSMSVKLPGKLGSVNYSTPGSAKTPGKRTFKPDNPLNAEREVRIIWDKGTKRALDIYQQENPMGTMNDPGYKKYLPTAFSSLGPAGEKAYADYLKKNPQPVVPENQDPWGLLTAGK